MTAPTQPNKSLTRAFLASLPHKRVNIWAQNKSALDENGKPTSKGWIIDPHNADEVDDVLGKLTRQHDVYFSVNEPYSEREIDGLGLTRKDGSKIRFNKKIRDNQVKAVRFLVADLDPKEKTKEELRDQIDEFLLLTSAPPTHVIDSGSGYWLLWEMEVDGAPSSPLVQGWNKRIAAAFDSDDASTDASRVARLPGFVNNKFDPGRVAHVVEGLGTGKPVKMSQITAEFGGVEIRSSSKSSAGLTPEEKEQRRKQAQELALPENHRALIKDAIDAIPHDHEAAVDYNLWRNHIWSIAAGYGGDIAAALEDAYSFSQKMLLPPEDWDESTEARLDEYDPAHEGSDGGVITIKTLFNTAKACGWNAAEARTRLLEAGTIKRVHGGGIAPYGTVITIAEAADYFMDTYFLEDRSEFFNAKTGRTYTVGMWRELHTGVQFVIGYKEDGRPIYHRSVVKLFQDTVGETNTVNGLGFHARQPHHGIFVINGKSWLITYKPIDRRADPDAVATPFLDHLKLIYPEDWKWIVNYFRHLVQKPGDKVRHAPILQGAQGCGKTMITKVARDLVGQSYATEFNQARLDSGFNGFLEGNLLIVINDLEVKNGIKSLNDLKTLISDDTVVIEAKGREAKEAPNFASVMITTNHKNSVSIKDGDRRYWPLFSAMQTVDDMTGAGLLDENGVETAYFADLHDWLNKGGLDAVYAYMKTTAIEKGYEMTGRAPKTSSIEEAIKEPCGVIEEIVFDAIEQGVEGFVGPVLSANEIVEYVRDKVGRRVPPRMATDVLTDKGYSVRVRLHASTAAQKQENKDLFGVVRPTLLVHKDACFGPDNIPEEITGDVFAMDSAGNIDGEKAVNCYKRHNRDIGGEFDAVEQADNVVKLPLVKRTETKPAEPDALPDFLM